MNTAFPATYLREASARYWAERCPVFSEAELRKMAKEDVELSYTPAYSADVRRVFASTLAYELTCRGQAHLGGHVLAALAENYETYSEDEFYEWHDFYEPGGPAGRLIPALIGRWIESNDALAAFLKDHGHELTPAWREVVRRLLAISETESETLTDLLAALLAALIAPADETTSTREHGPPSSRRVHCRQRRHLIASAVSDDPAPSRRSTLNVYGDSCRRSSLTLGGYVAPLP